MNNSKILNPDKELDILKEKDIVFTSGVFDLLHVGHINFLRKAKEIVGNNGYLVVVIHDDKSVKEHKGEHRPINTLEHRLDFLSELVSVDFVVPWYGWDNITELAERLSPKYFAVTSKNYDHSVKGEWKGKSWEEIANKVGAKIVNIDVVVDFSTSQFEKVLKALS